MELAKVNSRGRSCTEVNAVPVSDNNNQSETPLVDGGIGFSDQLVLGPDSEFLKRKKKTMKFNVNNWIPSLRDKEYQ